MKQQKTAWAFIFLTAVALLLMGMHQDLSARRSGTDSQQHRAAVPQTIHRQIIAPLPVTATALADTPATVVLAATTATVTPTETPAFLPVGSTPEITVTPTLILTRPPTPDLNPFTPTPMFTATPFGTPLAIFLPSIMHQEFRTLRNGDFEAGTEFWEQRSKGSYRLILSTDLLEGVLPHGGDWAAWLGGYSDEHSALTQTVTVPAERPFLRYWYKIGTPTNNCAASEATVTINHDEIFQSFPLCELGGRDWTADTVDLSLHRGKIVTLTFAVEIRSAGAPSSFYLDDVEWVMP